MSKNKKPGFKKLKRLKEKNEMTLFKKNDDHLAIVLAIKHNAWLITQDTFKSHKNRTKRKRTTSRVVSGWQTRRFDKGYFYAK